MAYLKPLHAQAQTTQAHFRHAVSHTPDIDTIPHLSVHELLQTSDKYFRLSLSGTFRRSKHTLPDLPYDYNALEPTISAEVMKFHHSKHHQTYVNNLNVAEEKLEEALAKGLFNNCEMI